MAVNPTRLKPFELIRLVNSTPQGEALNERRLRRHRASAGARISDDGQTVNLIRYAAWLVDVWIAQQERTAFRAGCESISRRVVPSRAVFATPLTARCFLRMASSGLR